jgi:hypothetical protein
MDADFVQSVHNHARVLELMLLFSENLPSTRRVENRKKLLSVSRLIDGLSFRQVHSYHFIQINQEAKRRLRIVPGRELPSMKTEVRIIFYFFPKKLVSVIAMSVNC